MADPAWDIHMELPYGTLNDEEMMNLPITQLQDIGFIFLWVTGRYKKCDEIIWVKINQLQRLIRTGRTGHWLNHGKEHCLVRDTSHKPDEIYGIIERLWPNSRKIGFINHLIYKNYLEDSTILNQIGKINTQSLRITLGNQLDGIQINDPDIIKRFKKAYPNGYNLQNLQNPTQ
ncbi:hypothetical protein MXB_5354 [Myxobolus squamalis]|nr:hypothetical protein MXB_5354 [Myxobolus squamalis]